MKKLIILGLILLSTNASAQNVKDKYQLTLMGLQKTESSENSNTIAVVVSNRRVIRYYQNRNSDISKLRRSFGGRCGCRR